MHKAGEERSVLFLVLGIVFAGLIGMLVFSILKISTSTRDAVLTQQQQYDLTSDVVTKGLFSFVTVYFSNADNTSCAMASDYTRPVIMTLAFDPNNLPETCSFFVNDSLLTTERDLCGKSCSTQQFNRQFSIGKLDYRISHTIKACCNAICIKKELSGLCYANPQ